MTKAGTNTGIFKRGLLGAGLFAMVALSACYAHAKPQEGSIMPGAGDKNRKKEPIEVTSDTLEVFQQENRAVFSGHVVAIQGDTRLKADTMTIFYNPPKDQQAGPDGKKNKPTPKPEAKPEEKGAVKPPSDAVKKIDVKGSVFLSTPEETASGDNGTYDVENNMIFLNDNVVLTRGQNVLKGSHLTYNFSTGKSVLTSAPGDKAAGSSDAVPGQGKQRVRALFVPENGAKEGQKGGKPNQNVTKDKK